MTIDYPMVSDGLRIQSALSRMGYVCFTCLGPHLEDLNAWRTKVVSLTEAESSPLRWLIPIASPQGRCVHMAATFRL